jgi:hypothetical protein
MPQTLQRQTGTGPVVIGHSRVYAHWEYHSQPSDAIRRGRQWTVRISLDEYDRLGLFPYQWVPLQLPGRPAESVFFQGGRDDPPYVLLDFDR